MELDIIKCANCGNIDLLEVFHRVEADDKGHPTIEILKCQNCNYESDTNDDTFELVAENNICEFKIDTLRDKQRLLNRQSKSENSCLGTTGLPF